MRKSYFVFLFVLLLCENAQTQECVKEPPKPAFSDSIKKVFEKNLARAEENYKSDKSPENLIWYGRRLAYLGCYGDAVNIFSEGIIKFPGDTRFYRHRGHRYITLRCFDKAISDLVKAAGLINGKPDEIEEDGLPNARNIPLSTLHTNIYYHLGLAYYLKAIYPEALKAFEKCAALSENDDMLVAALNWVNIILRQMGRTKDANDRIRNIHAGMELIENKDYLDILLLYKTGDDADIRRRTNNMENLSNATLGFGLGNYYLLNGQKKKAKEVFERILKGNQWSGFGFIAAEARLPATME